MTSALSDAQKAEARRLYRSDPKLSVRSLAASYGVVESTMLKVLAGITRRPGGRIKGTLTTEQMIQMRDDGITYFQIGKQAGLTESGVFRRIQRAEQGK